MSGGHRRRLGRAGVRCAGMEAVRLVPPVDADHRVIHGRLHEPHVQEDLGCPVSWCLRPSCSLRFDSSRKSLSHRQPAASPLPSALVAGIRATNTKTVRDERPEAAAEAR